MCGLVGVLSKNYNGFSAKDRDVFHELLYIDVVRGDDSTGVMLVDRDGNLELAKEATDAQNYQRSQEYNTLMQHAFRDGAAMIGHNRKAPRGVINDENAHPFVVDDRIVLVHNGTLWGDHKKIADVEVDSHAIAHLIHQNEDDVEAALKEVNGAYALIWYDVQKRSMNFVRNSQRPLFFLETSNSWVWASEAGMLAWMASRHQLTAVGKIELLPEGELHTFTRVQNRWEKATRKLDLSKPVTTTVMSTPTYRAPDHCDMRPTFPRHPYANAWGNDYENDPDDEDNVFVQPNPGAAKVIVLPPPPQKPGIRIESARIKFSEGESRMARKQGYVMTHNTFSKAVDTIPDGSFVAGLPFDYEYVRGDNCLHGIFMYAQMVDDPDLMIRCYIEYDPANSGLEQQILNLCTAEKKCMFKVLNRAWHKHYDGDVNEGCGVIYAKEFGEVMPVPQRQAANEEKVS
jgi:predicted glutamine amidotransferase